MKKNIVPSLLLCLFFLLTFGTASAQVPRMINYQGLLLDNTGNPVPDGSHSVAFSLCHTATGSTAFYAENKTVQTLKGVFSVTIGSQTAIPASVKFDSAYYLAISVDGSAELSPRTLLTAAPYALNAAFASNAANAVTAATASLATRATVADSANALSAGVNGVVRSVNGRSGDILIQGTGSAKIQTIGSTITINIPPGTGNGIQGVINGDTSIVVTSQVGPVASVSVAPAGINNSKMAPNAIANVNIQDQAVSITKLSASNVTKNYVATADGLGNVNWQQPYLQLPYVALGANPNGAVFTIASNALTGTTIRGIGASGSGIGFVTNAAIWGDGGTNYFGVVGYSDGGSSSFAGVQGVGSNNVMGVSGISGSGDGVNGTSNTGRAGYFAITNSSSSAQALEASNAGSGEAVRGYALKDGAIGIHGAGYGQNNSIGVLGETFSASAGSNVQQGPSGIFGSASSTSPSAWSAGVRGINPSTNGNGIGVAGYQAGSGWGVYGETPNGNAVYGKATNSSAANNGVLGETASPNGAAVKASYTGSGAGIALQVNNGAIKVSGTNRGAFQQTVTNANKITPTDTEIDNPVCDGDPNAMLLVTNQVAPGNITNKNPIAVVYNSTTGHWQIENINGTALTTGTLFNVLVIKQ